MQPKLIIHGGAGNAVNDAAALAAIRQALHSIVGDVYTRLVAGADARAAVLQGCRLLENNPLFNSGTGSVLQSDGQVRMSAGLMDGTAQRFSGVINVGQVQHPIDLAQQLQQHRDHVLSDFGAAQLVRELGLPMYDPVTERRLREWMVARSHNFQVVSGSVAILGTTSDSAVDDELAPDPEDGRGTIGVVALDQDGNLAVGTSTGGRGLERVGRVSDAAMPAGTYASAAAAVGCTGIGEDIIDECLAARIVVRVEDGLSLQQSFERSLAECEKRQRDLGCIGIAADGAICWGKTSEVLLAAYQAGEAVGDTLDLLEAFAVGMA